MYLADTSIWIDILNNNATTKVMQLLKTQQLGLSPNIYFEVLQGSKNIQLFNKIKVILLERKFYTLQDKQQSYEDAAFIYSSCRQKGITIRSSVDCLIAQCAIENDLILLHNDTDFIKIAQVIPTLKQKQG